MAPRRATAIAAHLRGRAQDPASWLIAHYPRFRSKRALRWLFDRFQSDWVFNRLLGTAAMRRAAELVYFHRKGGLRDAAHGRPEMTLAPRASGSARRAGIVVLTGAGMSAESGVPTFRDAQTGLWSKFRPEDLATEEAFRARPAMVWDWYAMRRAMVAQVEPNAGHRALADFASAASWPADAGHAERRRAAPARRLAGRAGPARQHRARTNGWTRRATAAASTSALAGRPPYCGAAATCCARPSCGSARCCPLQALQAAEQAGPRVRPDAGGGHFGRGLPGGRPGAHGGRARGDPESASERTR
jgi:hypothetical protein